MRRPTTTPETSNPWGMTPRQVATMEALVRLGCSKAVARELQVSTRTVAEHLGDARRHLRQPNRVRAVVEFDRWWRSQTKQPAPELPAKTEKGP